MFPTPLTSKKRLLAIGLNSGTSADGLDLAAVRVNPYTKAPRVKFIKGKTVKYPPPLYRMVQAAIGDDALTVDDIIDLDRQLGRFYGKQAAQFIQALKRTGLNVNLVVSHGQTVRHRPGRLKVGRRRESGTLQLGHPETIAYLAGRPVIADVRQADIAAGGEGAPITSLAMYHLFASDTESRLLVNVGGIANYFLFPRASRPGKMRAADCGPGNSLMDILSRRFLKSSYDPGGRNAARGTISRRLLALLTADNFLKGKYGPSTGRERFGVKFADRIAVCGKTLKLSRYDIMATTTELTALSIATAIGPLVKRHRLPGVYLLGGGGRNRFLTARLAEHLGEPKLFSVDALGFNPDYLEAVCYALMGVLTACGRPAVLPHITGAIRPGPAGRLILPPDGKMF